MEKVSREHPNEKVEVWAEDEHRLGLQPIIRSIWVPKECKNPTIPVKPGYQWFYLYAFVHPESGRSHWWILPSCNLLLFEMALAEFAEEFGAGKGKQIIIVVDQASWHTSRKLKVPEGIHFCTLPVRSPELQPAERLWRLSDETVANKVFDDIEQMKDIVWQRCDYLTRQTELISSLTSYHWWPPDVS